jgi:hypothetical protein
MTKFDRYIGIDAGKGGAIAHISAGRPAVTVAMPESVEELKKYLDYLKEISACPLACVEKVGMWKSDIGQGTSKENQAMERGKAFGIEKMVRSLNEITTLLRIVKIPFIQVYPIQWQAYLNLRGVKKEEYTDRKRRFKEVSQKHFPEIKVTLTNSDALLIMEFIGLKCQRELPWVLNKLPESIVKTLEL